MISYGSDTWSIEDRSGFPSEFRTPAEWERLDEVILVWGSPGGDYYNMQIVREVAETATAQIVTTGGTGGIYDYLEGHGVNMDNVSFASVNTNTGWIRDYGPISIINENTGEMAFANMRYRRHTSRPSDDDFPQNYAPIKGVDCHDTRDGNVWYSNDGGNFIVDGAGLYYGTDAVYGYNSHLTEAQVEEYSIEYFNLERFTTVTRMPGEGTGHIDMGIKMLNETTVLVSELMGVGGNDGDYLALEAAAELFQGLTARNGQPYEVVRIPMERIFTIFPLGDTYYTYSNSLIVNDKILVPIYGRDYDDQALSIYEDAMPGYEVIGIDSSGVITQGGAIHCTTMQIAKSNRPPVVDIEEVIASSHGVTISANIETSPRLSFAHLYYNSSQDDTLVRVNMEPVGGDIYQAELPAFSDGTEIRYFVQVEDDYKALTYNGDAWNMHTYEIVSVGEPPEITLTAPTGGEVWEANTQQYITWTSVEGDDPTDTVDLWYSSDNGATWTTIVSGIPDSGSHTWTVPDVHSTLCRVRARVRDTEGRTHTNESPDTFTIMGEQPGSPSGLEISHYGTGESEEVDNGMFEGDYEPWILTRVVSEGEARWDNESYIQGGSVYVQAEATGEGNLNTEESYWQQDITPTADQISISGAFRKEISTMGVGPASSNVNHAAVEILVHDTAAGWQIVHGDHDTSDGDTDWIEFESTVYDPVGEVDAVRLRMHVEAEGNTGPGGGPRRAEGRLWMDHISVTRMDMDGDDHNLLTWSASPDDPGDVVRYNIYRSELKTGTYEHIATVDAQGNDVYDHGDEGKGLGDDIFWWYVVHAQSANGRECQGTDPAREPGGPEPTSFSVAVDDITVGGAPEISIYDVEDQHGLPFEGGYTVSISIGDHDITEYIIFTQGEGDYLWEPIHSVGEYTAVVTMNGITEHDTFFVSYGDLGSISVSPVSPSVTAGDSIVFTAIAYDIYGNEMGDMSAETEWHAESGAGGSWNDNIYSSEIAGEWMVTGSHQGQVNNSVLTVSQGVVDTVDITPSQDQTISAGIDLTFSASAYDSFGNLITDSSGDFTWGGTDTSGVFNEETVGTYDVTATYGSETSPVTTVTVEPGPVDSVVISPDTSQTIISGDSIDFSASAYDAFGNLITDDDGDFTWSGAGTEGLFDESEPGNYTVGASYEGVSSSTVSVTVDSLPDDVPFFRVTITSYDEQVSVGDTVTVDYTVKNIGESEGTQDLIFMVDGVLEGTHNGITLDVDEEHTDAFTWSPVEEGNFTLMVSSDDHSDSKSITVEPLPSGPWFRIEITYFDREVDEGEEVSITYNVVNTGDEPGTQDIKFLHEGMEMDVHLGITLEPGQEHTDTFTWISGSQGTYVLVIWCEDSEDSVTVTVSPEEPDEPVDPENGEPSEPSFVSEYWWLIILLIIAVMILVLWLTRDGEDPVQKETEEELVETDFDYDEETDYKLPDESTPNVSEKPLKTFKKKDI